MRHMSPLLLLLLLITDCCSSDNDLPALSPLTFHAGFCRCSAATPLSIAR